MEIQVQVTAPDKDIALQLTKAMVQERLAACTQIIGPIWSTYWWKGEVETDEEWLCLFKTTSERYAKLEARIVELHPFEVPQVVALELKHGLPAYREWIRSETSK